MSASVSVQSQTTTDRCPTCGTAISKSKFLEITKIAEDERKRLAEERAHMQEEFRSRKQQMESAAEEKIKAFVADRDRRETSIRREALAQAETRLKGEADKKVAAVAAERDLARSKIKEFELAKQRHQKELQQLRSDLDRREASIREEAATKAEVRLKAEADKRVAALEAQRDQAKSRIKELELAKREHKEDLDQLRSSLETDRDGQLLKQQVQHNREREQLQRTIDALNRQVQRKTADELGDGAEVDVYEALRNAFPRDDISRVKKGQPGADIRHEVVHKGTACGTILLDTKNRQGWQNGYVTKLREDQIAAKAEHAVLATMVFPSGKKELYVDRETRVIVAHRARVVEIVGLIRTAMVRMHQLGLSLSEKAGKQELLYTYISSEEFRQYVIEAGRLTTDILELDTEEKRTHDKVWEKRGKMAARLRNVVRSVDAELSAILEGRASGGGKC